MARLALLLLVLATNACGGGSSDGAGPTPPRPPLPVPVATVVVSVGATSLVAGDSTAATAELRDAAGAVLTGRTVTWSSATPTVATIDGSGRVRAIAPGTAALTATSEGRTGTATLTVTPAPVTTVHVTLAPTVALGATTPATAEPRSAAGTPLASRVISWDSSDPAVASVSATGVVMGLAAGTTKITATSEGRSGSATIAVSSVLLTRHRGGSNAVFYRYPGPDGGAFAYSRGTVLHYHEPGVRDTVRQQLREMHENGQRSLRILVWYAHAPGQTSTTAPAESSRKCDRPVCTEADYFYMPRQFQQNLRDYLSDIRGQGFERVMLALGPQWINDFFSCNSPEIPASIRNRLVAGSALVDTLFDEAWGVAREVRAIARTSGLPYLIDLGNEYIPASNIAEFAKCAQEILEGKPSIGFKGYLPFLWERYTAAYGFDDTIGFSVIVSNVWDADNRLARMPALLSPLPRVLSLHTYSHHANSDLQAGLERARTVSDRLGPRPWIIGETNNRSLASANALRDFLFTRRQEVIYVLQWPGFNCTGERECLPLDFSVFTARGM